MPTQAELFAFIDRGVAFLSRPVRRQPQGYAYIFRGSKTAWELILSEHPSLRDGAYTRLRLDDSADAHRLARHYRCKPMNF